jgi:hypothetical protein
MRSVVSASLIAFAVILTAPLAHADDYSALAACPPGNVLDGRRPSAWQDIRRDLGQLTDGNVAPEGAQWDASPAVLFDTPASVVTWDLQRPTTVRALSIQADANDTYTVWGSLDGQDFRPLGRIDTVEGHGLRTRTLETGGVAVRFLRVGEGVGDNFYSVSEVAAYCDKPNPFPPAMRVVEAPAATVNKDILYYWNNESSARWELILALLGMLYLLWERKARTMPAEPPAAAPGLKAALSAVGHEFNRLPASPTGRKWMLGGLGLIAFFTYFNFGFFHFPNYIHGWDTFHYYIGAKYSRELSYDRLYECVAIADSELPALRRRVELRKVTNLRTNVIETTADILAHPERCKQHFTPERWQSFHHDLAYFRTLESAKRWDDAQLDHGYNATPVWNILGSFLSNLAPASATQIYLLNFLDPAFVIAMCLMIWWAFGWRALCVGLLVFATNFPSRFYWTGGAFLRWDWLFWMVAAVCLLKKQRPFAAGIALAYSAMLRVFPGFLFVAPLLAALYHLIRNRKLHPTYLRFFLGAAVALAVLLPAGMASVGRTSAYRDFMANTMKHSATPLTNNMGLRTAVIYRPSQVGRLMQDNTLVDSWAKWKEARLTNFQKSKPVYIAIVVGFLALLGLAARKADPWIAAALSAAFIPFGVELTCYYYSFLIVVALLWTINDRFGVHLLALTAFTQFAAWAPFGMPSWFDEQYTFMSIATVLVLIVIVWQYLQQLRPAIAGAPAEGLPAQEPAPATGERPKAVASEGPEASHNGQSSRRQRRRR